jgi:hypothetical protein
MRHRCCAIWSISSDFKSHFGVVLGRCRRDPCRRRRVFISFLPCQRDRLFHFPQPHQQTRPREHDREIVFAQTAHEIEGFPSRLFLGQGERVVRHSFFNGRTHLRRGPEESVRGDRTPDALMRPPEVVGLDEERNPPLAIVEIGKDGA